MSVVYNLVKLTFSDSFHRFYLDVAREFNPACRAVLNGTERSFLSLTASGMCSWSASWRTVARVFALVVRCRVMRLIHYSRVGKNRDTRKESTAGAGAGRTADHLTVHFNQKTLAMRSANCIYRPVMPSCFLLRGNILFFIAFITPVIVEFDSTPTIPASPSTTLKFHVLV